MARPASRNTRLVAFLPRPTGEAQRLALVIDDTTAHLLVPPELGESLLSWYCAEGIACRLHRGGALGGRDTIDFGNPPPRVEKRICHLFLAWQKSHA